MLLREHLRSKHSLPSQVSTAAATVNIPARPRAMKPPDTLNLDESLDQIRKIESTRLYPKLALYQTLARFKDKHQRRQQSHDLMLEARRDFLDSFAYICDTEKGGKTVTASALQQFEDSGLLVLAANEGIRSATLDYAKTVLNLLQTANEDNKDNVASQVLHLVIQTCGPRIAVYKTEVQRLAVNCRMQLRDREKTGLVTELRNRLKNLQPKRLNWTLEAYIDHCHSMRDIDIGRLKSFSVKAHDDFAQLTHYIWRLGATRAHVNTLVRTMLTVPSLDRISGIVTIPAPKAVQKTLELRYISPFEVLSSVVEDSSAQNPLHSGAAFNRLHQLDLPPTRPIYQEMTERSSVVTRVHAELQIADRFSRNKDMAFVDDDKFIGCSKSACYFCYSWLDNHKHDYVLPATHWKVISGCRGPDERLNENGAAIMLHMYSKLHKQIGQDILEFLEQNARPRRQYMSTEASTRPPSSISSMIG